jgi:kinesin family protein 1
MTTAPRPVNTETLAWKAEELLKKSVELWQKQFGHRGEVSHVPLWLLLG